MEEQRGGMSTVLSCKRSGAENRLACTMLCQLLASPCSLSGPRNVLDEAIMSSTEGLILKQLDGVYQTLSWISLQTAKPNFLTSIQMAIWVYMWIWFGCQLGSFTIHSHIVLAMTGPDGLRA